MTVTSLTTEEIATLRALFREDAQNFSALEDAAHSSIARVFIPRALAQIEAQAAEIERLREALRFYAGDHENPSEGPWGAKSTDFGARASAALGKE